MGSVLDTAHETAVLLPKSQGSDDAVFAAKMRLVNRSIDQIGFTAYHMKLFCLSGFGYAADSLMGFLISVAADQVVAEYRPAWTRGGQVALYAGLLLGSFCWGLGADVLGRRGAFHLSLFVCAFFGILAGLAPSYGSWAICVALSGFGEGGNIALDATVFLEFLPSNKRWLVTTLACWWGVGQAAAGLLAWPLLGTEGLSCSLDEDGPECLRSNNMGWRYLYVTAGSIILLMATARGLLIRLHETPQYLVGRGQDADVVDFLTDLATAYRRPCDLTLEALQACGTVQGADTHRDTHTQAHAHARRTVQTSQIHWLHELRSHFAGLFSASHRMTASVLLLWLAWALIGLAYPLFYLFLPEYLASRGPETQPTSVWVGFLLTNVCAIPGPVIAGWLCEMPAAGRKGTMSLGALATMASFVGYTAAASTASPRQGLFWSCAISMCINVYYATLYAYTPEVLPPCHRATGYGVALAANRLMGIVAALVVSVVSTATATPLYLCAGLFFLAAVVSVGFPIETRDAGILTQGCHEDGVSTL
ncbi:Filamentous Growth Regulator [Sporothrix curviconia]|uniref:Filamentous Growth Regulator n=1 Tax=Sporothrix curviconia TaxID=1260050 RepID=A0ABP0B9I8_9PEZI